MKTNKSATAIIGTVRLRLCGRMNAADEIANVDNVRVVAHWPNLNPRTDIEFTEGNEGNEGNEAGIGYEAGRETFFVLGGAEPAFWFFVAFVSFCEGTSVFGLNRIDFSTWIGQSQPPAPRDEKPLIQISSSLAQPQLRSPVPHDGSGLVGTDTHRPAGLSQSLQHGRSRSARRRYTIKMTT
jgi:hypothetical protein